MRIMRRVLLRGVVMIITTGRSIVVLFLLIALSACGQKEREELKTRVANLERDVASANAAIAEKDAALKDLRGSIDASGASLRQCVQTSDTLKSKVRKLEIERDKLRADLKTLKAKRR